MTACDPVGRRSIAKSAASNWPTVPRYRSAEDFRAPPVSTGYPSTQAAPCAAANCTAPASSAEATPRRRCCTGTTKHVIAQRFSGSASPEGAAEIGLAASRVNESLGPTWHQPTTASSA
jgi:hypothetical protein